MMKRRTLLVLFLVASCSAHGGGETAPAVDAAHESNVDSFTDRSATSEQAPETGPDVALDAGADGTPDANLPDRSVIDDRPFYDGVIINIFDARGPDGACWIPPGGPWTGTDPDTGLAYCLYPPGSWQSVVCDCIFSHSDGGFVTRD